MEGVSTDTTLKEFDQMEDTKNKTNNFHRFDAL